MTTWILHIFKWGIPEKFFIGTPHTIEEFIAKKDVFLERPNAKYIIHELNTKNDEKIFFAMANLLEDELKTLYYCKKALTAQEIVLELEKLNIPT